MNDCVDSRKLVDFNISHGFTNTIKTPTRLDPIKGLETLLDVILSSSPSSCLSSTVIPFSNSDHRLIISVFNFKSEKYKFCKIPSRCLDSKKIEMIKVELAKQFKCYTFDSIKDSNLRWHAIKCVINLCLDKIAPIKQVNVRSTVTLPWYDKELVNLAHKRNRLYNKWFDSKSKEDRDKYVESRNKYNSIFRNKKSNYYKIFVSENSASTKSFWQKLNPFLNPNKKESISISLLSNSDNNIHSSQDLVQAFSNFFSSILNNINFIDIETCKLFVHNHFSKFQTLKNLIPTDLPKFEFLSGI